MFSLCMRQIWDLSLSLSVCVRPRWQTPENDYLITHSLLFSSHKPSALLIFTHDSHSYLSHTFHMNYGWDKRSSLTLLEKQHNLKLPFLGENACISKKWNSKLIKVIFQGVNIFDSNTSGSFRFPKERAAVLRKKNALVLFPDVSYVSLVPTETVAAFRAAYHVWPPNTSSFRT